MRRTRHRPFPEGIIQQLDGRVGHGSLSLTDQPVFVLRTETQSHTHTHSHTVCGHVTRVCCYLPVDVEVGVPGGFGAVEAVLVLRGRGPGGVRGRSGDHHEERRETGFVLEEVQRHVGLEGGQRER